MKKIITLFLLSLVIAAVTPSALAQGNKQAQQSGGQQQIQDPSTHNGETAVTPQAKQQGLGLQADSDSDNVNASGGQGISAAAQSLNRVTERKNDPEIGQQVRAMVENHQQLQVRTETAIQNMSKRGKVMKFLLGPDYKNAGQVRSDVVSLRNDIIKLQKMKDSISAADAEDIQTAIDELQAEADGLDSQLEEQLSGFSLFGWLGKRLAD